MKSVLFLLFLSLPLSMRAMTLLNPQSTEELLEVSARTETPAEWIDELVDQEAQIQARDDDNHSPLMNAARCNNAPVCRVLIARGASIHDQVKGPSLSQFMPLHFAAAYGNPEACEALLENGADVFANACKYTSLDMCIKLILRQETEFYFTHQAEIDQKLENGEFDKTFNVLITHAWAPPDTNNPSDSLAIMTTLFLSLTNWSVNGWRLPREAIPLILQGNQELRTHLCALLLPAVRNNKPIPQTYHRTIAHAIYTSTLEKLLSYTPALYSDDPLYLGHELLDVLSDRETLDYEYGRDLYNTILNRINNPTVIHPPGNNNYVSNRRSTVCLNCCCLITCAVMVSSIVVFVVESFH